MKSSAAARSTSIQKALQFRSHSISSAPTALQKYTTLLRSSQRGRSSEARRRKAQSFFSQHPQLQRSPSPRFERRRRSSSPLSESQQSPFRGPYPANSHPSPRPQKRTVRLVQPSSGDQEDQRPPKSSSTCGGNGKIFNSLGRSRQGRTGEPRGSYWITSRRKTDRNYPLWRRQDPSSS